MGEGQVSNGVYVDGGKQKLCVYAARTRWNRKCWTKSGGTRLEEKKVSVKRRSERIWRQCKAVNSPNRGSEESSRVEHASGKE